MKEVQHSKQDSYEGTSELFKPIVDVQKDVNKTIDDKQDKLIEKLQQNQKAIKSGLEDIVVYNQLPETTSQKSILPPDYQPEMMKPKQKYQIRLRYRF